MLLTPAEARLILGIVKRQPTKDFSKKQQADFDTAICKLQTFADGCEQCIAEENYESECEHR